MAWTRPAGQPDYLDPDVVRLLQECPWGDPKRGDKLQAAWQAVADHLGSAFSMTDAQVERILALHDRYYLFIHVLGRVDGWHPWLYARCREVELNPDGYLDLWARDHYKSSLITQAGIIQEHLRNPSITIGLFSHTKPIAKAFLAQIKREYEANDKLKGLFPEIFWANPAQEAPQWALDSGLILKRPGNPKEASLEAHGLVDGQPTSKHFGLLVYDDVVTLESVNTPEQISKTTNAYAVSDNLGSSQSRRKWHIGTRYHFADTYHDLMDSGLVKQRIYPATDDGLITGNPVFLSDEAWAEKLKMPRSVVAAQQLLNPAEGGQAIFDKDWLRFEEIRPATLNVAVMVDPASSKKQGADSTAMAVVGIDAQGNYWLLDGLRDKLNLDQRWKALRHLYYRWRDMPGVQVLKVGYEKYGMQSDLEHFELEMAREGKAFKIHELNWPRSGAHSKIDRIQRLQPKFKNGKFFLAKTPKADKSDLVDGKHTKKQLEMVSSGQASRVFVPVKRTNYQGELYSLNKAFLDEYLTAPFSVHDDMIDCVSRIDDMDLGTPVIIDPSALEPMVYEDGI